MTVPSRGKVYDSLLGVIGNTPLVRLNNITKDCQCTILAKLEFMNPNLSLKDRAAFYMIEEAEKAGLITPGKTIIVEPTSGNTGIGLAWISALKGYKCIVVMPETMSVERRVTMASFGADVLLTPGKAGIPGAIQKAEMMKKENQDIWIPSQFENPSNSLGHELSTGPEIWQDTQGKIDYFVAGGGTCATLSGCSKYLKSKNPSIKVVAVEPDESAVLSGEKMGPHGIQGIGAGFVPGLFDPKYTDQVLRVKTADAIALSRRVATEEGMMVGISAGAALAGALKLAEDPATHGKTIVVIFPDSGSRYLSTPLFSELFERMTNLPTESL